MVAASMDATGQQASCQHGVTYGRRTNWHVVGTQTCVLRVTPSETLGTHGCAIGVQGACDSSAQRTPDRTGEGARLGDSRRIGRDPRSSAEVDFVGLCGGMQVGSQGLHRGATTAACQGAVEHVTSVGVSTWQESAGLACRW